MEYTDIYVNPILSLSSSNLNYIEEHEDNITSKPIKGHDIPYYMPYDDMEYTIIFSYSEFVRLQEELLDCVFFFCKIPPKWIKSIVDYNVKDRNKNVVIKISKSGKDYIARKILFSNKFDEDEKVLIYNHVYN